MKFTLFTALLQANRNRHFQLSLPDNNAVPVSFHITEVGYVQKRFIDCGGKVHETQTCQLQAWVGPDVDHRIEAGKMADILGLASKILPVGSDLDVEIEYEDAAVSQYPVQSYTVTDDAVVLNLKPKHTDCLAKDLCLLPMSNGCGPSCNC